MYRAPRQLLDHAAVKIAGAKSMLAKLLPERSTSSTRLTSSNDFGQLTSAISRMLVMMLRTVTFDAPCRWCSSRTISSAVVSLCFELLSSH